MSGVRGLMFNAISALLQRFDYEVKLRDAPARGGETQAHLGRQFRFVERPQSGPFELGLGEAAHRLPIGDRIHQPRDLGSGGGGGGL